MKAFHQDHLTRVGYIDFFIVFGHTNGPAQFVFNPEPHPIGGMVLAVDQVCHARWGGC